MTSRSGRMTVPSEQIPLGGERHQDVSGLDYIG